MWYNRGINGGIMGKQSIFVGDRFQNKSGLWYQVTEYITGKDIKIEFDISGYECFVEGQEIRRGCIVDSFDKYPKPGERYTMKGNGVLEIIEYNNARNVVVRFLDTGYVAITEACQIKRGTVRDYLKPRALGVGVLGEGDFQPYDSKTGKVNWSYLKWQNMLERCYEPTDDMMARSYTGVTVCESWLNYQNFASWAINQIGYNNARWALEKDVINKYNKIYSPENCCFLPQELNNLILKSERLRGDYPIGVGLHKSNMKYVAHVSGTGNSGYVGIYGTPEEAFLAYKKVKEKRIKSMANKWKSQIDPRAYEALMNYEVLITD